MSTQFGKHAKTVVTFGWCLALSLAGILSSCSSSTVGLSSSCSLNSDCNNPLVCAFAKCHQECNASRDCTAGGRCVASGPQGTGAKVCQLEQESTCGAGGQCPATFVCGPSDSQCRAPCENSDTCAPGQYCVSAGGAPQACYQTSTPADEPTLMAAGILSADGSVLADAAADSAIVVTGDSAVGPETDGGAPDSTLGGDGAGGSSEGGPRPCTAPQIMFGNVAQGDSNPGFTSGVGVRTATQLLIFDGYVGPAVTGTDGGADGGNVNLVYVQAFDPATAQSQGPATVLFQAPDGAGFTLEDVSIDPAGDIALAFGYGGFSGVGNGNSQGLGLYSAFLAPTSEAGAASLQVGQIRQLESARIAGQPHVIWSAASQVFVFSWTYYTSDFFAKVAKFLPDGRGAGGNSDIVPTDNVAGDVSYSWNFSSGASAASGNLLGVAYVDRASNFPYLTILDALGNEQGSTIPLLGRSPAHYWVAVGGTAQGFVAFVDNGSGVSVEFIPTSADGGLVGGSADAEATDGGEAGIVFPGFSFTGALQEYDVRPINDDTGGLGGVGAVFFAQNGASFAYVNADGLTHVGVGTVISHNYAAGDFVTLSNYRGTFAMSLFAAMSHSTQVAASGCGP